MSFDLKAAGCSLDSFNASTVTLIVEGKQYRVNSFFLGRDSPVLREMFWPPREIDSDTEPESRTESFIGEYWAPSAVWRDILKLASMWQMTRIKYIALSHLRRAKLDPIEKIKDYECDHVACYEARDASLQVCTREESLTPAELQALGMNLVLLIMQIRERVIANRQPAEGKEKSSDEDIVDAMIGRESPSIVPERLDDGTYC
ncbi:hypothetical protein DFH09DRAFT_1069339 [Mycena vulgaris]|nr:hypothetical protein DFH09DRAFT_1069339 [Mycena vulgaris]